MTYQAALQEGFEKLKNHGIDTAMLDATVLLGEAASMDKVQLYVRYNEELPEDVGERFEAFLKKRLSGYPVSYIRRKKEFYGDVFYVDERVLVPRPETELLVELIDALIPGFPHSPRIHDLCTGTGCVPISLKKLHPELIISASDISPGAGEVFTLNCLHIIGALLPFTVSDLFEKLEGPFDILSANPPYIRREEYEEMKSRNWPEPELALNGGEDGLDVSRRLIDGAWEFLRPGGVLLMESGFDCMKELCYYMENRGFKDIRVEKDLAGLDRVITGRK